MGMSSLLESAVYFIQDRMKEVLGPGLSRDDFDFDATEAVRLHEDGRFFMEKPNGSPFLFVPFGSESDHGQGLEKHSVYDAHGLPQSETSIPRRVNSTSR